MVRDIPFSNTPAERYLEIRKDLRAKFGINLENPTLSKKIEIMKDLVTLLDAAINFALVEHDFNNKKFLYETA